MQKKIKQYDEARKSLAKGVETLVSVVASTLGPAGRNIVLEDDFGTLSSIRDGVSIVREMELSNPFQDAGVRLLKDAAVKTNDAAGDGTTTATVLAGAIVKEGMRNLAAGANPVEIKRGIDKAVAIAVDEIKNIAKEVSSSKDIEHVATISAANDKAIGSMVAKAMDEVGKDGIITIEESKSMDTELEVAEGMQFDKGLISPYFVTNEVKAEAVLENPYVLCVNKKITLAQDLIPLLEAVAKSGRPIFIIAEDVDGEALAALVVNNHRKIIQCAAVKPPSFGRHVKPRLEDICILTGSRLVGSEDGFELKNVNLDNLGQARRVVVTRDKTIIVANDDTRDAVNQRIKQLDTEIENAADKYIKDKTRERKAKLVGGIAVIKVGAPSEAELKDKKLRLEDAIHATKAAVEEGIVPGGGTTQLQLAEKIKPHLLELEGSERIGAEIVVQALRKLTYQIAENAGIPGDVVISSIPGKNKGFNAATGEYVDMFKVGIVDPAKVSRASLQNAASVAAQILLTDALVVNHESKATKESY